MTQENLCLRVDALRDSMNKERSMSTITEDGYVHKDHFRGKEHSGVSWGAVFAGGVAATVLTLILIILGMGIGFASVSPWANEGASAEAIGVGTIVWITLVSLAASAIGGYIAGRLRPRWNSIHTNEVYFRDTAHGFLAWGISTLLMATLLSSTVSSVIAGSAKAGAAAVGGAATAGAVVAGSSKSSAGNGNDYLLDKVFRRNEATRPSPGVDEDGRPRVAPKAPGGASKEARMEAAGIFVNSVVKNELPAADKQYLAKVVAREANITEAEASKRIQDTHDALIKAKNDAKEAADKGAAAAAYTSLWLFISLLLGAFVASWCATCGGRCRDEACLKTDCCITDRTTTVHQTN
jgi:hypothetical protein